MGALALLKEDFSHLIIQDCFNERTIYGLARNEWGIKVEKGEVGYFPKIMK
ncbi:Peptide synthetase [Bacillus mycoides]|nr:Peptide synthetase [Bacillus mycoides]